MTERPTSWSLWLPWPPSVNNLYSQKFQGGRVIRFPSTQYRKWRKEAVVRVCAARLPTITDPVTLSLALVPPDGRHRDASNYVKACEDALVLARVLQGDDARYVRSVQPFWDGKPNRKWAGVTIAIRVVPTRVPAAGEVVA